MKEAGKLAKLKKIEAKNNTLVNNKSFLFEDEFMKDLFRFEKNISYLKDYDWKEDDKSKDNVEMTDDNKDILDIDTFTKLLKAD